MVVPLVGGLISFVIALLIGGLAIYISARIVVDVDDYSTRSLPLWSARSDGR